MPAVWRRIACRATRWSSRGIVGPRRPTRCSNTSPFARIEASSVTRGGLPLWTRSGGPAHLRAECSNPMRAGALRGGRIQIISPACGDHRRSPVMDGVDDLGGVDPVEKTEVTPRLIWPSWRLIAFRGTPSRPSRPLGRDAAGAARSGAAARLPPQFALCRSPGAAWCGATRGAGRYACGHARRSGGYRPRTAVGPLPEAAGRAALALGARPDLVCSFAAPVNLERAAEGIAAIHERLRPKALVGCGAQGVVGEGREVETGGVRHPGVDRGHHFPHPGCRGRTLP